MGVASIVSVAERKLFVGSVILPTWRFKTAIVRFVIPGREP
jgi:hypothetical protein